MGLAFVVSMVVLVFALGHLSGLWSAARYETRRDEWRRSVHRRYGGSR